MKRVWKGAIIGGIVGGLYALIGIYYFFASGFVGYTCPVKLDSWITFIFYPTISLTCLSFFRNTGMIGFFVYSISMFVIFIFIGIILGKCCEKKI